MNPTATTFCAAAVLMLMFHRLSACATAIMSTPAKVLPASRPKARMMPATMGTMQDTRAVVDGTKKESRKPTKMTPMMRRFDWTPMRDMTRRAMRLSSPVIIMAAERNMAPATRAQADVENPASARESALPVPSSCSGCAGSGAMPSRKAMSVMMTNALTG